MLFGTGFFVAACNPTTAAFFTAQLLGPASGESTLPMVLVLVPVLALLGNGIIAALFARPGARRMMQRRFRLASLMSAAVLVGMAAAILHPVFSR
ncbi:MAG TPA: hypothetical protein VD970_09970 [Acetobacteraceae bacterium]|nr:hypothetical protein [Acetobacteraceae bacterium]